MKHETADPASLDTLSTLNEAAQKLQAKCRWEFVETENKLKGSLVAKDEREIIVKKETSAAGEKKKEVKVRVAKQLLDWLLEKEMHTVPPNWIGKQRFPVPYKSVHQAIELEKQWEEMPSKNEEDWEDWKTRYTPAVDGKLKV